MSRYTKKIYAADELFGAAKTMQFWIFQKQSVKISNFEIRVLPLKGSICFFKKFIQKKNVRPNPKLTPHLISDFSVENKMGRSCFIFLILVLLLCWVRLSLDLPCRVRERDHEGLEIGRNTLLMEKYYMWGEGVG